MIRDMWNTIYSRLATIADGNYAFLYRLQIRRRLSICFALIIALMLAGNCVLLWQFHLVRVQEEHLTAVDQQLIAVLRAHSGLMSFYEKLDTFAHAEDANRFLREAEPLRDTLLEETQRIMNSLSRLPPESHVDENLLPTLETIESALPSQLEVIAALAKSGDWAAVKLRLENEVRPLETLTSAMVLNADREVGVAQDEALQNIRRVQRRILIFVPVSALFTLLFAAFLGMAITNSINGPLNGLVEGSRALARREFQHQVNIKGRDELAQVGLVFNETARQLEELYDTLSRREEKLRQDERELRRITDAIPQLILVLSPDGHVLHANQLLLEYSGLAPGDLNSPSFHEHLSHPDDLEKAQRERASGLSQGVPFELEQRTRGDKGEYRWFLFRYNPLCDEYGEIIRWYATGTDIEGRKRAEERTRDENLVLREEIAHSSMFGEILGSSEKLVKVLSDISRVAPTNSTVLITGETGTGKELIARAIHKQSPRAARAFIRINCAAIPHSLISSELFGHEKGAFTGAFQRRLGRFEAADGGTILLDEIGELPAETQATLLRVLQEREFERVGSNKPISVDVRVLAATNRDLENAVAQGTFRRDLYYRLDVFPIFIPPLRERPDDIALLVEYFVDQYARKAGKRISNIQKRTLDRFLAYPWPGNVRELQNIVERAVLLCDGETLSVDESWLRQAAQEESSQVSIALGVLRRPEASHERELIEAALTESAGRISGPWGAAAKLGIPRQTLESKMARLGIARPRPRNS
jgi:formate hydrogenlyase transcriptional activator